jgi:hypothetical protein
MAAAAGLLVAGAALSLLFPAGDPWDRADLPLAALNRFVGRVLEPLAAVLAGASAVSMLLRKEWVIALSTALAGAGLLGAVFFLTQVYPGWDAAVLLALFLYMPALCIIFTALASMSRRDFLPSALDWRPAAGPAVLPAGLRTYGGYVASSRALEAGAVLTLASIIVILCSLAGSLLGPGYWTPPHPGDVAVSPAAFNGHVLLLLTGATPSLAAAGAALLQRRWSLVRWLPLPALALIGAALMRTPGLPSWRDHLLFSSPGMIIVVIAFVVLVPASLALCSLSFVFGPGRIRMRVLTRISVNTMACAALMGILHAVSCVSVHYYHLEDLARGPDATHLGPVPGALPFHLMIAVSFTLTAALVALALWRRGPLTLVLAISTAVPFLGWLGFHSYAGEDIAYLSLYNFLAWGLSVAALAPALAQRILDRRAAARIPAVTPLPGTPYPAPALSAAVAAPPRAAGRRPPGDGRFPRP